jgi:hypothetical protein
MYQEKVVIGIWAIAVGDADANRLKIVFHFRDN